MNFSKLAHSQAILKAVAATGATKQAGILLPLAIGAGAVGTYAGIKSGLAKAKGFKAGFRTPPPGAEG